MSDHGEDPPTPKARSYPDPNIAARYYQSLASSPSDNVALLGSHNLTSGEVEGDHTSSYFHSRPALEHRAVSSPTFAPSGATLAPGPSHSSHLNTVSESGSVSAVSDATAGGTGTGSRRGRRRERKSVKPKGAEEEWTIFGQLFEGHRAAVKGGGSEGGTGPRPPSLARPSGTRQRSSTLGGVQSRSNNLRTASGAVQGSGRPFSGNLPPLTTPSISFPGTSPTTPRPIIVPSNRGRSASKGQASASGSVGGSNGLMFSPPRRQITEEPMPLVHAHEGQEDILHHHKLGTDADDTTPPRSLSREPRPTASATKKMSKSRSRSHSNSSSSSPSSTDEPPTPATPRPSTLSALRARWKLPQLTVLQRNMLKCAGAYFLASLFTFVPYLSSFISDMPAFGTGSGLPSPTAHTIATV